MTTVGTYNIQKPGSDWETRKTQLFQNIKEADLDIVTLQEVSDSAGDVKVLNSCFSNMGYSMSTHTEKPGATSVGVIWKSEKFECINKFSGTYSDGTSRKRCFSAVDLKNKKTQKIIRVASLHLYCAPRDNTPHLGIPQLSRFRTLLESNANNVSQIVIAGDFNADFGRRNDDAVLQVLAEKKSDSSYLYHTVEKTTAGEKIYTKGTNKIDWIFVGSKEAHQNKAPKLTHHRFVNPYPHASDHKMHAVVVHDESVSYVQRIPEPKKSISDSVMQALRDLFARKSKVVRDDLIYAGLVTKDNCNQLVSQWVDQGLIMQHGKGRDTYYTKGEKVAATKVVTVKETRPESSAKQRLDSCFSQKERLVRDDLIYAGLVTRDNCNQLVSQWIDQGLIVQHGKGRDTYYTSATSYRQSPLPTIYATNSPVKVSPAYAGQSQKRRFMLDLSMVFISIGALIAGVAQAIFSQKGKCCHR